MSIINQNIEPMPTKKALVVDKLSSVPSSTIQVSGRESAKQLLKKLKESGMLISAVDGVDDLFSKLKKHNRIPKLKIGMRSPNPKDKLIIQTLVFEKMEDFGPKGILQQNGFLQLLRAMIQDMKSWKEAIEKAKLVKEKLTLPNGKQQLLKDFATLKTEISNRQVSTAH